ncbi:MAG: hypothetical protein JSW07_07835 [bacterium]|nr:MAG: hypothetical protein JSW07_07835 [bacterium]
MPLNLVDALSIPGERRAFYLPLASIPPGGEIVRDVLPDQFDPEDDTTDPNNPGLFIRITPSEAGDEFDLPDPAFRLHAMAAGTLHFKPLDASMGNRLILTMPLFQAISPNSVPWWGRWDEARCWPSQIIYDNVDVAILSDLLNNLVAGTSYYGLEFPPEVDVLDTGGYITNFLNGSDIHFLNVQAGAVIGAAGFNPSGDGSRLLKLYARYHDHTDSNPHPMHPREFLHLLFGNSSDETTNHSLLLKIDEVGIGQPGLETRSMRLRPPLRTQARVIWEADLEVDSAAAQWAVGGAVGPDRFFNDHSREGRQFNNGAYDQCTAQGCYKCNLFVCDVALRAGFRVNIHPVRSDRWHYISANRYARLVHDAGIDTDRVALQGSIEGNNVPWGWKIESWLRSIPVADRQERLNDAMNSEGRCFILAGGRAGNRSGHVVIVESVDSQPILVNPAQAGHGLDTIELTTREARRGGASMRSAEFGLNGTGGAADSTHNFNRLHLFELHPGEDPDTLRGLRNCNVQI